MQKMPKFWHGDENFVRRKILFTEPEADWVQNSYRWTQFQGRQNSIIEARKIELEYIFALKIMHHLHPLLALA